MKRTILLTSCILTLAANAQTNVGGVISGNVTWTSAGNPYTVTSNTLVQFTATLTIMPGVQINFNSGLYLQVDGTLRVEGSSASPVIFQSSQFQNYWGGIRFTDMAMNYDSTTDTGNRISHAVITGMNNWTNSISIDSCWVRVHKTEITGGQRAIDAHNSSSFLDSNLIHDTYGGGINCWDDATNVYSPWNIIRGNTIHHCQYGAGMAAMRGIMEGNIVYNVPDGASISNDWLLIYNPVFVNNVIENCDVGLYLAELSEGGIYTGNVFRNNVVHVKIYCDPKCQITCNRFMNSVGTYKVEGMPTTWSTSCPAPGSGNYYVIDLDSNSWDGMSSTALDTATYDFNDNFAVGLWMSYVPMLTDTDACLSAIPPLPPGNPPAGISEQDAGQIEISVYPNPASHFVNVVANDVTSDELLVELFSVDGRLMYSHPQNQPGTQSGLTIDISNYPAGVYVIKVTAGAEQVSSRLIKFE